MSTDVSRYELRVTLEQNGHSAAYVLQVVSNADMLWNADDQKLPPPITASRKRSVHLLDQWFAFRRDHEPLQLPQPEARLTERHCGWTATFQ